MAGRRIAADALYGFIQQSAARSADVAAAGQVQPRSEIAEEHVSAQTGALAAESAGRTMSVEEFLSGWTPSDVTADPISYTVQKGDSLARIAREQYGSERALSALMADNNLTSTTLQPGQSLVIRGDGVASITEADLRLGGDVIARDAAQRADQAAIAAGLLVDPATGRPSFAYTAQFGNGASSYAAAPVVASAIPPDTPSMTPWDGKTGVYADTSRHPFYGTFQYSAAISVQDAGLTIAVPEVVIGQAAAIVGGLATKGQRLLSFVSAESHGITSLNNVQARAQALLDGAPGLNFTSRADGVNYRINMAGGNINAGTALTDFQAFESVVGTIPSSGSRMVITAEQATSLERSLGLPTGRVSQRGGILSIVDNVAARSPRSPISGNNLFAGGGKGLPGGGPEINIAPINTSGGGGIRQIIVEVKQK